MAESVFTGEAIVSSKNIGEFSVGEPILPQLVIPPIEMPPVADPKRELFKLALEFSEEKKIRDGERAYHELQDKGYFVPIDSTVEALLTRVTTDRPEDPWIKDERTGQYLKHAIETARKYAGDHAIWELGNLGIPITEKSTASELLNQVKTHGWIENDLTKQFLSCGINGIKEQKRQEQIAKNGENSASLLEWGIQAQVVSAEASSSENSIDKTSSDAEGIVSAPVRTKEMILDDLRAKEAYDKLTNLGFWVRADSDRAAILTFVTNLNEHAWQDDEPTRAYIENALDYAEAITPKTQQFGAQDASQIKYLTGDPHSELQDSVFLPQSVRDAWGISPGQTLPLRIGDATREITVERPRVRDNGTIEGEEASPLRVSQDILDVFGIPKLTPITMRFDKESKIVSFDAKPETIETKKILYQETRGLSAEKVKQSPDTVYLSTKDQARLQLVPGDIITLKVGNYLKQVTVDQGQQQEREDASKESWTLSQKLIDDIGIPEELALRAVFDKEKKELMFGPTIAIIETGVEPLEEPQTVKNAHAHVILQEGSEYGALAISIDPRRQTREDLKNGFVSGVVWTGSEYKHVRIPRPDVLYGKMSRNVKPPEGEDVPTLNELRRCFPKNIVDGWAAFVGADKLWFDHGLVANGLEKYRAEAKSLRNITPEDFSSFLEKHEKVIVKPQVGAAGVGVFEVTQEDDGSYMIRENIRGSKTSSEEKKETIVPTANEVLQFISEMPEITKRGDGMSAFMMQEKIDMYEFGYDDPLSNEPISGHPEPRVMVQRGVDGKPIIGGIVARMQNDKVALPHNLHIMDVLHGIYKNDNEKIWQRLLEIERVAVQVLEMAEKEAVKRPGVRSPQKLGEFIVDFAIRANGELAIIEASSGAMTNVYQDNYGERVKNMQDALSYRAGGPIAYALHVSGMSV